MQLLIKNLKTSAANFMEAFAISAVLIVLIFWFVGQPLEITGKSMLPTFEDGEHTITNKLIYKFNEPKSGEIVIVKHPENRGVYIIKRIIAKPQESFEIKSGIVYINDSPLNEPYLAENTYTYGKNNIGENEKIKLNENEYILLGDNRENSFDSRNWGIIARKEIIGKSAVVYYPFEKFRIVQ